jgi:hypothetical protein
MIQISGTSHASMLRYPAASDEVRRIAREYQQKKVSTLNAVLTTAYRCSVLSQNKARLRITMHTSLASFTHLNHATLPVACSQSFYEVDQRVDVQHRLERPKHAILSLLGLARVRALLSVEHLIDAAIVVCTQYVVCRHNDVTHTRYRG